LPQPKPGAEYWLNLDLVLRNTAPWAEAGYCVTWAQFKLPVKTLPRALPAPVKPVLRMDGNKAYFEDTDISINPETGLLEAYRYRGVDLLSSGPLESFFRPPLDNDWIRQLRRALARRGA
jgi:beta-galactosidase